MAVSRVFLPVFFLLTFVLFHPALGATEDEESRAYQGIESGPESKEFFDSGERQALLDAVSTNPVARIDDDTLLQKYDPTGEIGYCYGRAMTGHLTARRWGLASGSIRKLFAIGDMRQSEASQQPEWRFHVTTLVKGQDGKWWAIDPIMTPPLADGKPLPAEAWMDIVSREWDKPRPGKNYHLYFYFVENAVIVPEIRNLLASPIMQYATFDPSRTAGFHPFDLQGRTVYEVDAQAEAGAFINVRPISGSPFQFLNITIEGHTFEYHGYFVDLLKYLQSLPPKRHLALSMQERANLFEQASPTFTNFRHNLYSPRFDFLGGRR